MQQNKKERYEFEIPKEGLSYDILDITFNPSTERFLEKNALRLGMKVLDVGCGSGVMTHYLASQVGPEGSVLATDISAEQLSRAEAYCTERGDKNIQFQVLSAYELEKLKEHFDLIYCRFVLHHLHSPRKTIELFYNQLKEGGIYIAEEGIISAAFSYPPSSAWHFVREVPRMPDKEVDGIARDGEFGMKLIYWMKKNGFSIKDAHLVQPILSTYAEKIRLLEGHYAYKKTALEQGLSEEAWEAQARELTHLAEDEFSMIGFYQSCQVCGVKN